MGLFTKKQHEQVRQPHISDDNAAYTFRRSRTMTGSLSNSVRAAAESHADLQSDRLKHHTLRKKRRHLFLYLLVVMAVITAMTQLLNHFMLSTALVPIKNVSNAQAQLYHHAIDEYLTAHPNERFSFSLRAQVLTQALQQKFPEVQNVTLSEHPWLKPAEATITLRKPIASWTIGTTKYYIDDRGVAFQRHVGAEPALIVEDKTGIDPNSTGAVASERMIYYIGRLVALLGQSGYRVEKIELPPVTSREVNVRLAGKSYLIKTNLDRDPAGQVADVVQAVRFLDSKQLSPAYADVRVSSRLYYK